MPNYEANELDRIIDQALASYVEVQPSPNMERRLLGSVHHATRRRHIWQFAAATPLLAASLILLVTHYMSRPQPVLQPVASNPVAAPVSTITAKLPPPTASATTPQLTKRPHQTSTRDKDQAQNYLTIPGPVLTALAHETPEQLQALFTTQEANEEQPQALIPIQIDEIDIKPIATEPLR